MDDLVQFLRARLDEDEQAAAWPNHQQSWEACGPRHLSYASGSGESVTAVNVGGDGPLGWDRIYVKRDPGDLAEHIARHDPERVLAEVDTKRLLVYQFENRGNSVRATVQPSTGGVWDDLLRMLALPYSDHPDYRDTWRP